jgi:hypothetical protein
MIRYLWLALRALARLVEMIEGIAALWSEE